MGDFSYVNHDFIVKKFSSFPNKLTSGLDKIPAILLKNRPNIAVPLKLIFELSLRRRTFPFMWKCAKICLVFKKGDRALIFNYRPILLLSNFSKVFENFLYKIISAAFKCCCSSTTWCYERKINGVKSISFLSIYLQSP